MQPPPLANDCFALPPGVDWTPVDTALAHLGATLSPVAAPVTTPLFDANDHFLAEPLVGRRANPPAPNAAVDGFAFAGEGLSDGVIIRPLAPGRAAAGAPFTGTVPPGAAVRILTGALLPKGADTVVLEEDCTIEQARIAFRGPLKRGANTRRAGEDFAAGAPLFPAGHRLRPQDLALAAAAGHGALQVHRPLRVAVLSTGDEVCDPGATVAPHQTFDANRPMLLALIKSFGMEPVDLGRQLDRRAAIEAAFSDGARAADAIITTGGASAGDEDHVSAALKARSALSLWRIAVKPGRPLALGVWEGVPIFGLPGNPVAAFVCALVFVAPALRRLAGGVWRGPEGIFVPAAFSKNKKAGRREFLRARLNGAGAAEVFSSEGSGRITSLTFADGLVELPDGAAAIAPGTPVRYVPIAAFRP
ncbi:MAG: gephyrin-like molybdotransferase Glp [Pseudomonadota bacterium]